MKTFYKILIWIYIFFCFKITFGQNVVEIPLVITDQIDINIIFLDSVSFYITNNNPQKAKLLLEQIKKNESEYGSFYRSGASELKGKYDQIILTLNKKNDDYLKQINSLNQTIEASKQTSQKEWINFMEDFLKKRDLSNEQIANLTKIKEKLEAELLENNKMILKLSGTINKERDSVKREFAFWDEKYMYLTHENDTLNKKLAKYRTAVQFGLSMGFNYYFNNQLDYFVREDSTIREAGSRVGASGMISSVISIRLSEKDNAVINIPLGDFTSDPSRAVGLFNQRIGLGLGYARRLSDIAPNLLLSAIINISPYPKIDYGELKNKKFNLPEYTKLNANEYGASNDYSYSITLGLVWNFINTK